LKLWEPLEVRFENGIHLENFRGHHALREIYDPLDSDIAIGAVL